MPLSTSCSVGDAGSNTISYRLATAAEVLIQKNVGAGPILPNDQIELAKSCYRKYLMKE